MPDDHRPAPHAEPDLSFPRRRAAHQPPAPRLGFTADAQAPGGDTDVLMGYQVLLGRDPENSQVILDAKSSPVAIFIRACFGSGEFRDHVLVPLATGRPLRHEAAGSGPNAMQRAWLARHIGFTAEGRAALHGLEDWRDLFALLAEVEGYPRGPAAAEATQAEAAPAAAETPQFVMIALEQPNAQTRLSAGGKLSGSGWVIAPGRLTSLDVLLDGEVRGQAQYGLPRADIGRRFAHYTGAAESGFAFQLDLPAGFDDTVAHEIGVRAMTVGGAAGERSLRLMPAAANAEALPLRLEVQEASVDPESRLRLRGLALSPHEIVQVSVFLGASQLTDAECGLESPAAAASYPAYKGAAHAGFVLIQALPDFDFQPASLRVIARDAAGTERERLVPLTLPVRPAPAPAKASRADGFHMSCDAAEWLDDGQLSLSGWALAEAGLAEIAVLLDGEPLGCANYGRPRPDVARRHRGIAGAASSGFHFTGSTTAQPAGHTATVTLVLRAADGREQNCEIPVTSATVAPTLAEGFIRLEIDRPALPADGAPVVLNGALMLSGWAVAGSGLARVTVTCLTDTLGELALGDAHLGTRREDIAAAFPDCPGSLFAGYALVQPPGVLPPGSHRVRLVACGNDGTRSEREFALSVPLDDTLPRAARVAHSTSPAQAAALTALLGTRAPAFHLLVLAEPGTAGLAALHGTLRALERLRYDAAWSVRIVARDGRATQRLAKSAELAAALARLGRGRAQIVAAEGALRGIAARGSLVMRLRAGDTLGADALQALSLAYAAAPGCDFLTADDERHDPARAVLAGFAKPTYSPELLLGLNYIGRAWAAPPALLSAARLTGADIVQASDWDAALRLSEAARRPVHAPHPVLHQGDATDTVAQGVEAVRAALRRRGIDAGITGGPAAGTLAVRRVAGTADVSIIMPTCGARDLIRTAITSIRATSGAHRVEIVVLDNIPDETSETRDWLRSHADVLVPMPGPFNWSAFNNAGARAARGAYLLFLNDDIEATEPGWLDALIAQAARPEIAIAGARLLYPGGKVQHGGQYLTRSHARHAFRFAEAADPGPFGLAQLTREVSAVTGACMMIRREVFDRLGGFDEGHSVVNNDVDMCLRARRAGLGVMLTPQATLIHHELVSRARIADIFEADRFFGEWHMDLLRSDPFHSPRLLADSDHYAIDGEPPVLIAAGRQFPRATEIRRILAVKLDHIGDFLTAGPAVAALAARFPKARIDLLVPPASAALARAQGFAGEIIEFTFFHARSGDGRREVTEAEFAALAARLAPNGYDIAIDLRMQPETRPVLRHTGAAILAGYDHRNRYPWLDVALEWESDERLVRKRAHVARRLVELVATLEVALSDLAAPSSPSARAGGAGAARKPAKPPAALTALRAGFGGRKLVAMHPGVGNTVRQWPAAHFAALTDLLVHDAGVAVVMIGGPEEAGVAEEVLRLATAGGFAGSLAGKVKLAELPALLAACDLFVGNNSGPKHIAAALGLPTIGVHSSVIDPLEWAPLGPRAVAIKREMSCGPCYLEFATDCPRAMACLTGLQPSAVYRICRAALVLPPPAPAVAPPQAAPAAKARPKSSAAKPAAKPAKSAKPPAAPPRKARRSPRA